MTSIQDHHFLFELLCVILDIYILARDHKILFMNAILLNENVPMTLETSPHFVSFSEIIKTLSFKESLL